MKLRDMTPADAIRRVQNEITELKSVYPGVIAVKREYVLLDPALFFQMCPEYQVFGNTEPYPVRLSGMLGKIKMLTMLKPEELEKYGIEAPHERTKDL